MRTGSHWTHHDHLMTAKTYGLAAAYWIAGGNSDRARAFATVAARHARLYLRAVVLAASRGVDETSHYRAG